MSITPLPTWPSIIKLQKEESILPYLKSKFSHLLLRQMLNSNSVFTQLCPEPSMLSAL